MNPREGVGTVSRGDAGGELFFYEGGGRTRNFIAVLQVGRVEYGPFSLKALRGDGKRQALLAAQELYASRRVRNDPFLIGEPSQQHHA